MNHKEKILHRKKSIINDNKNIMINKNLFPISIELMGVEKFMKSTESYNTKKKPIGFSHAINVIRECDQVSFIC
jgi:hypothetical protein